MSNILALPSELHLIITKDFTDPCDLLSLRLTHPIFNTLLKPRFDACFPASVYTRNWPGRGIRPATAESMLHWAARENHLRFAKKKLMRTSPPNWEGPPAAEGGVHFEYTNIGLHHAACAAARNGHQEMLGLLIDQLEIRFEDDYRNYDVMRDCFDIAVSEENHDIAKSIIRNGGTDHETENRDGKTALRLVMDAHQVELLDYMLQRNPNSHMIEQTFYSWADSTYMDGWCQGIVSAILNISLKWLPGRTIDARTVIDSFGWVKRRECGTECDIWLGKPKKLSWDEVEEELIRLQSGVESSSQEEAWPVLDGGLSSLGENVGDLNLSEYFD